MHKADNIFLQNHKHNPAPWQNKTVAGKRNGEPRYVLQDRDGVEIAHLSCTTSITPEQFKNNRKLIEHAPEMLAALVELLYAADTQGIRIEPRLYALVAAAGGPEIEPGREPEVTEPTVLAPEPPER